jgi:hypothetical protein
MLLSGAGLVRPSTVLATALAQADPTGEPGELQLRDLQAELEESLAVAKAIGYEPVDDPSLALMSEDEIGKNSISLKAGESDVAAAVCGFERRHLEMERLDTDGFVPSDLTSQIDRVNLAVTPEEDSDDVVAIKGVRCGGGSLRRGRLHHP